MSSGVRAAIVEGWPLLLSVLVVGVPFGIVARGAGLDPLQVSATSLLIFAGAAQFAAVDLIAKGAAPPLVVLVALLINLRHLLMAAALRPLFGRRPLAARLGLAYLLTDESFAMAIGHLRRGGRDVTYYAAFGALLWACWNAATIAGALVGSDIVEPRRLGLDFAITAAFVAIVALGVRGRSEATVALLASLVAAALGLAGASVVAVLTAGALAPLATFALPRDAP